jgi:hypothetical protein
VSGFGATIAAWNTQHEADTNATFPNSAYDPTPNLPGGYQDEYYNVSSDYGHIGRYEMALSPVTESDAKRTLLKKFPRDASVRWFKRLGTCAEMEVQSAALGQALSNPKIGDGAGEGYVELTTGMGVNGGYNPTGVTGAIVTYGLYKTPSAAPPC